MLWLNDLETGLLPTCCFTNGWDSPIAASGKELLLSFRTEQTQPISQPKGRLLAKTGTVCRQLHWIVQRPTYLWDWVIKKCREKQRQQATKQAGRRTESANKSTSPIIMCFRNSTLTQPYLFHKGNTKRDSTSLSFSLLTRKILRTVITN